MRVQISGHRTLGYWSVFRNGKQPCRIILVKLRHGSDIGQESKTFDDQKKIQVSQKRLKRLCYDQEIIYKKITKKSLMKKDFQ